MGGWVTRLGARLAKSSQPLARGVRRSAQLKGTQTWTEGGKTMSRACSGAIKRPLKPFLPRNKKPAAA